MKSCHQVLSRILLTLSAAGAYTSEASFYKPSESSGRHQLIDYSETVKLSELQSKKLAKFSIDNSSPETRELVKQLYSNFGVLVEKFRLDADDLNFILEAVPDARATFSWRYTPNSSLRIEKLGILLTRLEDASQGVFPDDFDSKFDQYAGDMETLLTAVGYRSIGPGWIKNTTVKSEQVERLLKNLKKTIVAPIGDQFEGRFDDGVKEETVHKGSSFSKKAILLKSQIQCPLTDIDTVHEGLEQRFFKVQSYVGESVLKFLVPMRAHVSGSAPLTLAAVRYVLNFGEDGPRMDLNTLLTAGGLICALYELGDYHTIAETSAGIIHYLQIVNPENSFTSGRKTLKSLSARQYFSYGAGMMSRIVSKQSMHDFTLFSHDILENIAK